MDNLTDPAPQPDEFGVWRLIGRSSRGDAYDVGYSTEDDAHAAMIAARERGDREAAIVNGRRCYAEFIIGAAPSQDPDLLDALFSAVRGAAHIALVRRWLPYRDWADGFASGRNRYSLSARYATVPSGLQTPRDRHLESDAARCDAASTGAWLWARGASPECVLVALAQTY